MAHEAVCVEDHAANEFPLHDVDHPDRDPHSDWHVFDGGAGEAHCGSRVLEADEAAVAGIFVVAVVASFLLVAIAMATIGAAIKFKGGVIDKIPQLIDTSEASASVRT